MAQYSDASRIRLNTCREELQKVFQRVLSHGYDHSILEGHRGKDRQDAAVAGGKSKVTWPNSKHNSTPSSAVDAAPFPVRWPSPALGTLDANQRKAVADLVRFYHFAGYVRGVAAEMGVPIRSGEDWDGDFDFSDQNFNDLVHFEIKE